VVSCLVCCLNCFEKYIRFINNHAYIEVIFRIIFVIFYFLQCALSGKNFCDAAEFSFYLILRNSLRFGITHGISSLFTVFGEILVVVLSAFACYFLLGITGEGEDIISPVGPVVFVVLSSYIIAKVFISIYTTSADSILHFFCADEEIHAAGGGRAKYCPTNLKLLQR
jgi:Plasma-membrane choline transporter